jgi:hypothetical protein
MSRPDPLQPGPNRQAVDSERITGYKEQMKRDVRRTREEHCMNTARGVNIPQMSQAEMREIGPGLADLFMTVINSMVNEFQ